MAPLDVVRIYDLSRNDASAFHSCQPSPVSLLGEPSSFTVRISPSLVESYLQQLTLDARIYAIEFNLLLRPGKRFASRLWQRRLCVPVERFEHADLSLWIREV